MEIQMSLKRKVLEKAFAGSKDPFKKIATYNGSPNGARTADFKGQLCYDVTNDNVYINTTNATTWTKVNY
jgi:hypothetical protein